MLAIHQVPVHGRDTIRDTPDITGKTDRYSLRDLEIYADEIQDALRLLPGVSKVEKFGVRDEAVYIESDLGNWSQIELTTLNLQRLADERNIIQPGGEISTESGHYSVKPGGEFDAVGEILRIANVARTDQGDNAVYLSDLGLSVQRGYEDPPTYICRYGNTKRSEPAVTLGITMKSGSNIIDICERSKRRVRELIEVEQRLPADIAATPVSDQSENVAGKINDVIVNMLEAIAIVVIVVYLLVGFRTSFVMAANIPVVIVATLGLVTLFGVELEQISLAALIISLGLLVDNAVQVCDQARTNQMAGMSPVRAAIEGANTLAIPMLVGTLTTVFAFLPMLFALRGGAKEYVYSLPVTVSVTLAVSWLLAMTFCVILAAAIIRVPADPNRSSSPVVAAFQAIRRDYGRGKKRAKAASNGEPLVMRLYRRTLGPLLRFKWLTVAATMALIVAIMSLPVSSEFFPEANRDQFAIKINLPETATIEQTDEVTRQVEEVVRKLSPVQAGGSNFGQDHRLRAMRTLVGGGGSRWHLGWDPEPPARNFAEILVRTTDGRLTNDYADRVREVCERGDSELGIQPIVGARVVPLKLALGPPADPVLLRVIGNGFADANALRTISKDLEKILRDQPETWNVNSSWGVNGYQVSVDIDPTRATLAGITNSQVARTLNSYYTGLKLTDFREGDHVVPVYFRLRPEERKSVRGLQESFVEGDKGKVPLAALAKFGFSWEPAKIERRNMNRVIEVAARVETGVAGNDVVDRILKSDAFKELEDSMPAGFWIEPGGSYAESQDAGGQMGMSFLTSLFLILFCLIVQYNGW
ncbi:MAG: efflux RND transporter permease subunit, partial [Planctomycetota bacterium]